ncbi:MAG: adenine deaminase [Bacteroidales bacterium]|nr:adenine deaminase [Bacteroidales bacterium]
MNNSISANSTFTIGGQIVDLVNSRIFSGVVVVENGKISKIEQQPVGNTQYIMPGFVDAHVHIESSMLVPSEFARLATCHGTVATVSDPHEIANVLGKKGIRYMIENGKKVPFKFFFGAPSCVPSTAFETAGFTLDANDIEELMASPDIYYLSEVMNYPGVIHEDPELMRKIAAAISNKKPIDGHAPAVTGNDLQKYVGAGITTDHECFRLAGALEKISLGMKILIREGSAAKNFEALIPLMATYPDKLMFCSDDKHPNELVEGHIDNLVRRAIALGYNILDVLKAGSLNAVKHYNLNVGMLQIGDDADFIVVDDLHHPVAKQTYIKGVLVAENGVSNIDYKERETPNIFKAEFIKAEDLFVPDEGKMIRVIDCVDGQLITKSFTIEPKVVDGGVVSDVERDILKIVVVNRYKPSRPAVAFIRGFGLRRGALASSVAHDSHNIVAVGVTDKDILHAVNLLIEHTGGVTAYCSTEMVAVPLPVAGLMSNEDGYEVAAAYQNADALAKRLGSTLYAPFMTLAFMALLVIPELKLSDQGLFDVKRFGITSIYGDL